MSAQTDVSVLLYSMQEAQPNCWKIWTYDRFLTQITAVLTCVWHVPTRAAA